MHCPRCADELREVPKSGVLIDVCPRCRGVWLDRGELEKIMVTARDYHKEYERYYEKEHHDQSKHHDQFKHHEHHGHDYHKRHKKKGLMHMLEELFD